MYAHIWSAHIPTSRRQVRGRATHRAIGAAPAAASTRRAQAEAPAHEGPATPAATTTSAAVLNAFAERTRGI